MTNVKQVMVSLAQLAEFLASVGVVRPESVMKGCKKFVADHPEINKHLARMGELTHVA